jgi:hypothetical protein
MSVIIQNVSKKYSRKGIQDYVLKINTEEICRFQHTSKDGLSTLLFKAAYAVEDKEYQRLKGLSEYIKQLENMSKTTKKGNEE